MCEACVSACEVLAAITKLNNSRSPGADGIMAEMLKYSSHTTGPLLVKLFRSVWRSGKVPAEWKDGIITSLYKGKGPELNAVITGP